jgi:hypothetical protein
MAKDEFGTIIPRARDIIAIDGKDIIDKDGDRTSKDLFDINQALGGGYTLVETIGKGKPNRKKLPVK